MKVLITHIKSRIRKRVKKLHELFIDKLKEGHYFQTNTCRMCGYNQGLKYLNKQFIIDNNCHCGADHGWLPISEAEIQSFANSNPKHVKDWLLQVS